MHLDQCHSDGQEDKRDPLGEGEGAVEDEN